MTLDPDTIQGLITLVTLATALVAAVVAGFIKMVNVAKEAIIELRGLRQDQQAADVLKIRGMNRQLAASPRAQPVTEENSVTGTGDGGLDAAVADLTRKSAE